MNNAHWIKNDIDMVIDILQCKHVTKHNGVFFINVKWTESEDYLKNEFAGIVEDSGGAGAFSIYRSKMEALTEHRDSPMADYLLVNSASDDETVKCIVIDNRIFEEEDRDFLEFIMAHEIGHIVAGDLDPIPGTVLSDAEMLAGEKAADAFAKQLLGTGEGGKKVLNHFLNLISGFEDCVEKSQDLLIAQFRLGRL